MVEIPLRLAIVDFGIREMEAHIVIFIETVALKKLKSIKFSLTYLKSVNNHCSLESALKIGKAEDNLLPILLIAVNKSD